MKNIFTFCIALLALTTVAQPTLTSAWAAGVGQHARKMQLNTLTGISKGAAGANQTWNFASYDSSHGANLSILAPASGLNHAAFPGATVCVLASSVGVANYEFDKLNGNAYQIIGLVSPSPDSFVTMYMDPVDLIHFPATFNSTFSDASRSVASRVNVGGNEVTRESMSTVCTVDAYGTLITKAGTFSNVLRFKYVQDIYDTTVTAGVPGSNTDHYTNETYVWFSASVPGFPLAAITYTSFNGGPLSLQDASYVQLITTGIEDLASAGISNWSIVPMPVSGTATLDLQAEKNSSATVTIHDISGRQVSEMAIELTEGNNTKTLNVSTLADGIYMISIRIGAAVETRKLVVRN